MTGAATIAAVLLALVFGWAALAKSVRHRATVRAFTDLGLPQPAALGVAVPVGEAVIAVALVARPTVGAALALAALAAFTLVVVRAVSRGSAAGCACFGSRRIEPVAPADVVRNGFLAALAAVATGTTHLVRPGALSVVAMVVGVTTAAGVQSVARRRLVGGTDVTRPGGVGRPAAGR